MQHASRYTYSPAARCTADELDTELGDKSFGMGSSFRSPQQQQQTERGVANANQRRARALRVGLARGVLLIHDAFVEGLGPDDTAAGAYCSARIQTCLIMCLLPNVEPLFAPSWLPAVLRCADLPMALTVGHEA